MNGVLVLWDAIVESVAVIAIVVIAIGLMIGVVDLGRGIERFGIALGCAVLLLMLPPVIVGIWHALSLWQQFGIITLFGFARIIAMQGFTKRPKRGHSHRE